MPQPIRINDRSARERAIRLFSIETAIPEHVLIPWLIEVRPIYWRLMVDALARQIGDISGVLLAEIPNARWPLPVYYVSPCDIDSSGYARELPIYYGRFNAEGEPLGRWYRVGMGSSRSPGYVTYAGQRYVTYNGQTQWKRDLVYFLRLDPID